MGKGGFGPQLILVFRLAGGSRWRDAAGPGDGRRIPVIWAGDRICLLRAPRAEHVRLLFCCQTCLKTRSFTLNLDKAFRPHCTALSFSSFQTRWRPSRRGIGANLLPISVVFVLSVHCKFQGSKSRSAFCVAFFVAVPAFGSLRNLT